MNLAIYTFLQEIRTYTHISDEDMGRARVSKVTYKNNKTFRDLVKSWKDGAYDEDPESLAWECLNLIK